MLVGVVKLAPTLPVDSLFPFVHLDRKFMHLGFHIYDLGFQSPDADAATTYGVCDHALAHHADCPAQRWGDLAA